MQQQAAQCAGTSTISRAGISPRGSTSRRLGGPGHWRQWLAVLCLAFGMAGPAWAVCPSTVNLTVPAGGRVAITCAYDWGFLEVDSANTHTTSYGQVSVIPGEVYAPEYVNTSGAGQTDDFVLSDGDTGAPVRLIITIGAATSPLTVSPASLSTPSAGVAFSQSLSTTGGTAPYAYSLGSGTLPPGITLSSAGVISGTSTQSGPHTFTVHVVDSAALSTDKTYSVTIAAPVLDLTPDAPTAGVIGVAYNMQFATSGGTAPYTYALEAGLGNLPPGLSLLTSGLVTGTPSALGTYTFSVRHDDSTSNSTGGDHFRSQMVSITINPPPTITVAPTGLPNSAVGAAYSQTISGGGGAAPYTYAVTAGTLPTGLTLVAATGALSGTPTAGGTFNFTVTATDDNGFTGNRAYTLTVNAPTITVSPASLPNALNGTAYSQALSTSGGTATYSFAVTAGALPTGLTLSASGTLSGTPSANGAFNFTVTATDSSTGTGPYAGSRAYTLQVLAPLSVVMAYTNVTCPGGSNGSAGVNTSGGTPPYTYVWSPSGGTGATATGLTADTYTVTVTDTNTLQATASATITQPAAIVFAPASLPDGAVSTAYSQTLTASGGTGTKTFSVTSGSLPAGLSLAANGTLSGTPTATGTSNFQVSTTDANSCVASHGYGLTIAEIAPVAAAVSATVAYGSGANPITLNITAGTPTSVAIGTAASHGTAVASGTTITYQPDAGYAGPDSFTYTATNASGTSAPAAVSITVSDPTLVLMPASGTLPLTYGAPDSQTFTASGGTSPYSYTLSGTLPDGLSFNAITGVLSGAPTQTGSYPVLVTATDDSTGSGAPFSITQNYTLQVAAPSIVLTPASLPAGSAGTAYPHTSLSASGGVAAYSYAVTAGALPAGLALSSAGQLSGVPTAAGSFAFTVTVTDAYGQTGARAYILAIDVPTLTLSPATLASATAETAYSQTLTTSGGVAPYSYAITSGTLPAGLSLDANTGVIDGMPTVSGSFSVGVRVTDASTGAGAPASVMRTYALAVAAPAISLTPATLPDGTAGAAYPSTTLIASGGVGPYSYTLTGTVPAGMTFDAGTATLSGTPTAAGSFSLITTATDAHGFTASANYTLVIQAATLSLSPASLANATAETAYTQTLSASGGTAPYSYAVSSGSLPVGINLDANTGELAGTATVDGDFNVTVKVTDSSTGAGAPFSATQSYTLHVDAPVISLTPTTLPDGTAGAAYPSTTLTASGGVSPYSYVLTGTVPAGMSFNAGSATLSGTPTAAGSFSLTATATDAHGFTASANYTLVIQAATLSLSPATLPSATAEAAYSQALTTSGGVAPYSYVIASGALPAGLNLDAATGMIAGTPSVSGSFSVDVKVSDASTGSGAPASITKTYAVVVAAPVISITPASLPAAQQGAAYSQALTASGGDGSYGFTVTAGALPVGLSLSGNGLLAGTPTMSGSFGFTVTARDGLNFTGTQAYTLTVGVATPVAVDDTASTSANQPVTIEVTGNDSGSITSIAVATAPAHGTATVDGLNVVYTPAGNFFGSDTLTYTATGAGGTSAPATVTITVTPLAIPTAVAQTATTLAGTAVTIHATQGASGGPFTAVTLASTPASGTATVAGEDIVYTPAIDAAGSVSFTYTLSNAFGVSLPAAITVQVHPVPQAVAQAVNTLAGTPVQVELTTGATGGPFTAADVISIAPVAAGTAVIAASGSGADAGFRLTFTPAVTFAGVATVTYSLDNAYATSAAAVVTIDVAPRPDPSTDAEVLGVLAAQAGAARRFSSAQIGNFQQRMQGLHDGGASGSRFHNGVTFILDRHCTESEATGFGRSCATSRPADEDAAVAAPTAAATTPPTFAIWTGGALGSGDRDRSNGASALTFETSGVSAGADYRLSPAFAFGAGLGYGRDRTDVGDHGSRSDADNKTAALYASYHPGDAFYLDGLLGYQWLSFDTRRHATGTDTSVQGERDGTQWFASLAVGLDHRLEQLGISPYARLDVARARLDGYSERGAAPYALRYEAQDVDTTTGNVGLNLDYRRPVQWGTFAPKLRLEYQHDFQGAGAATMSFADLVGGPFYRATLDGFDRNRFMFGIGAALYTGHDLRLGMEYRRLFGSDNDEALLFNLEKTY